MGATTEQPQDKVTTSEAPATVRALLLSLPTVGDAAVASVLDKFAQDGDAEPTDEQRKRAADVAKKFPGLVKIARATYVLTGDSGTEQQEKAKQQRAAKEATVKSDTARKNGAKAGRRSSYPPEVTDRVKLAKKIRGTENGQPGAKQHVMVEKAVGKRDVLEVVGMSEQALVKMANGKMPREKLKEQTQFQEFAKTFDDQFCKGRNLASMLAALHKQRSDKS